MPHPNSDIIWSRNLSTTFCDYLLHPNTESKIYTFFLSLQYNSFLYMCNSDNSKVHLQHIHACYCHSLWMYLFPLAKWSFAQTEDISMMYCVSRRAEASWVRVNILQLHRQCCWGVLVWSARSRLLWGHSDWHGWQRDVLYQRNHHLSYHWTELWPELHSTCGTHLWELQEHGQQLLCHLWHWWDVTQKKKRKGGFFVSWFISGTGISPQSYWKGREALK